MKLSDLGEFGLIKRIERAFPRKSASTLLGIGDDAAALKFSPSKTILVTTDMLLEGTHFDLSYTDFYSLGWKSGAANLSDIAAMGGAPRFCLTSIGLSSNVTVEQISEFYRGLGSILKKYKTSLVGGDTCRSGKGIVVSVSILGDIERSRILTRSGARPGDRIFVTGTLGDSAAGLELLKKGVRREAGGMRGKNKSALRTPHSALIQRHLRPTPRVEWGEKIALSGCASAMIDISDGLSSDLNHICEQSGVGAEIIADMTPLSRQLLAWSSRFKRPALQYAMSGGEDYELLFTVPPAGVKKVHSIGIPVTEIGVILRGSTLYMKSGEGKRKALKPTGYDHFGARRGRIKA